MDVRKYLSSDRIKLSITLQSYMISILHSNFKVAIGYANSLTFLVLKFSTFMSTYVHLNHIFASLSIDDSFCLHVLNVSPTCRY